MDDVSKRNLKHDETVVHGIKHLAAAGKIQWEQDKRSQIQSRAGTTKKGAVIVRLMMWPLVAIGTPIYSLCASRIQTWNPWLVKFAGWITFAWFYCPASIYDREECQSKLSFCPLCHSSKFIGIEINMSWNHCFLEISSNFSFFNHHGLLVMYPNWRDFNEYVIDIWFV